MQEELGKRMCFILLDEMKSKGIYSTKCSDIAFSFTLFLEKKILCCGGEETFGNYICWLEKM